MSAPSEVMYGNWHHPRSALLGTLSTGMTIIGLVATLLFIVIAPFSLLAGLVVLGLGGVAIAMTYRAEGNRSMLEGVMMRLAWWKAKAKGQTGMVGGLLGEKANGAAKLPGAGGAIRLWDCQTATGLEFVLVEHQRVGSYSLVFEAAPEGNDLVDPHVINTRVNVWAGFLTDLGYEPGLQGASVVIETVPDTGERLRNNIEPKLADDAPEVALATMHDVMRAYPDGAAVANAYITLTYGAGKHDTAGIAAELASRVPQIMGVLNGSGAAGVRPVTASRLARVVRQAYDPQAARVFAEADAMGERVDIDWNEVGVVGAKTQWDCYIHEGARSITWEMKSAPRGVVNSSVLHHLLAPNHATSRKRVTLLYTPMSADSASRTVEKDVTDAKQRYLGARKPTERDRQSLDKAHQAAAEEARGAGLIDFGLVVTVTDQWDSDTSGAEATVETMAASSKIRLRKCWGHQDAAFLVGLPLGVVPNRYSWMPAAMRDAF